VSLYINSTEQRNLPKHNATYHPSCSIKREYVPSQYEMKHINKSIEISLLSNERQRLNAFVAFLVDDLPHSIRWLERVHIRSRLNDDSSATKDDEELLSKFLETKNCRGREWLSTINELGRVD